MDTLNGAFSVAPFAFLKKYCLDNAAMGRSVNGTNKAFLALNTNKKGMFDIVETGTTTARLDYVGEIGSTTYQYENDNPISAYWCPFINGYSEAGYVDIPNTPDYSLILTAAMQGCGFYIVSFPNSQTLRIYHNQHADDSNFNIKVDKQYKDLGGTLLSAFTYKTYAGGIDSNMTANAINLIWISGQSWYYVSQTNLLQADLSVVRSKIAPMKMSVYDSSLTPQTNNA